VCERAPCLRSPDAGTAADGLVRLQALALGSQNRKVAATCMNKESSRSHCCFALSVQITTKEDGTTTRKFSRFNLIDLAGSERQRATNATGDRLKEANNINRSLSALGNVIMALANSNGHVPYRDSKLTFMLKDSIGGNSKTCIIANCSPAQECLDETLSTLKFVRFAKLVRNMATVNSESAGGAEALKREIARLKAALAERDERLAAGAGAGAGDGVATAQPAEEELLPNQAAVIARVLAREAEARGALEAEKADAEVKMSALRSLTSAQEKQILGAKMAVPPARARARVRAHSHTHTYTHTHTHTHTRTPCPMHMMGEAADCSPSPTPLGLTGALPRPRCGSRTSTSRISSSGTRCRGLSARRR